MILPTGARAHAQQITGTVVDASGAVIAGASVQLHSANGKLMQSVQSGKNGLFIFEGVAAGEYQISASSAGFAAQTISFSVKNSVVPAPLRISLAVGAVSTTVAVQGRADDLIGIADSGTQGTVGAAEIQTRPILRSGEVLETVPGLIITQHAGGGKANQYFLRGFNLDHGTDFAIFLDGMPLNLPSHAHGEGYSDMNTVIPELVQRVNFEKGPYSARVGNFGSAGAAHLEFFKTLPADFIQIEGGMYSYGRAVFGLSRKLGRGNLLAGGEAFYDNGPWTHPDAYHKFNGLASYSLGGDEKSLSLTARGYHGNWHSSDQIPVAAQALVGFYGTLDPSGGGHSQRYSLQTNAHRRGAHSESSAALYGFYYDLDLFSDFTYFLTDTARGDQFEQKDRRWVAGLDAHHTIFSQWRSRKMENTFGVQLRNDWIHNGLYQTENRVRVNKTDTETGNSLPATTQADRFIDTQPGFYAENKTQWAEKFRSVAAVRGDLDRFDVTSLVTAANSGVANKFLPSPKLSLVFGPWHNTEFYAQGGFSFHSNDGRGTTQTIEPVSGENPEPNTPATPIPALIPTKGGELGVRTAAIAHLQSTLSIWYLHSASELQQSGDTGGTTASRQPSNRYGFEWANFYAPTTHLSIDFDLANSRALFTETDGDDAAPNSAGGKRVPEAVGVVLSSGVTLHDWKRWTGSLRLRNFGPRDLTSDGIFRSQATVLLNGECSYRLGKKWRFEAQLLNLLNRRDDDITYAYESRITPTSASAFTKVSHPVEPFQVRFALRKSFGGR